MSKKKRRGWPPLPPVLDGTVIDNHTHLALGPGQIPRRTGVRLTVDAQLARAKTVGVSAVISSACELGDIEPMIELAHRFAGRKDAPKIYVGVAIHPNEAALHGGVVEKSPDGMVHEQEPHHRQYDIEGACEKVYEAAKNNDCVVTIGETGLDYFRTSAAGRQAQIDSFKAHIDIAKCLDLPMQIHDRDAHDDTIAVLQECGAPERTVFHCYSGDTPMARICAENGWYCSFSGTVTFGPNDELRQALAALPRHLVLIETDAPYLTPHPHRGQPNASYMIAHTLRTVAQVWQCDERQACQQLLDNTYQAYPGIKVTV
ncbi:MAG: TatD family hydrolase [Actinomycetaceae bacterium]|nr:TatD family hydrolase [Actinomycetaceae bacterium]